MMATPRLSGLRAILRLVGQLVTVSVETVRLVRELAGLPIDQA
jgi:hypothetical protein